MNWVFWSFDFDLVALLIAMFNMGGLDRFASRATVGCVFQRIGSPDLMATLWSISLHLPEGFSNRTGSLSLSLSLSLFVSHSWNPSPNQKQLWPLWLFQYGLLKILYT